MLIAGIETATQVCSVALWDGDRRALLAESSLAEQRAMEAAPAGSFDDFVAAYRASTLCSHT